MIILKVTVKNQGFTLSLGDKFLEKSQERVKFNTGSFLRVD